jgi:hypothetical protein
LTRKKCQRVVDDFRKRQVACKEACCEISGILIDSPVWVLLFKQPQNIFKAPRCEVHFDVLCTNQFEFSVLTALGNEKYTISNRSSVGITLI